MRMIKPLARLHEQLRKLPGIGSKSALRLSYHVLDMKRSDVEALAAALVAVKDQSISVRPVLIFVKVHGAKFVRMKSGTMGSSVSLKNRRM